MNAAKNELQDFHLVTQHLVMTEHLNPNHHIFGGQLLAWLDKDVYIYVSTVMKHKLMVTLSMNEVYFKNPAHLGEIIQIFASIRDVGRSRVTALGKAVAYDPEKETMRNVIECQISYVAIDEAGKPTRIKRT